mmetsp:Transcript_22838/g.58407  ORF Transcript_22838/g.58407 Transcript_22838/m.58407 type:complete len:281 (-) Transcript_22838:1663-2505(-)
MSEITEAQLERAPSIEAHPAEPQHLPPTEPPLQRVCGGHRHLQAPGLGDGGDVVVVAAVGLGLGSGTGPAVDESSRPAAVHIKRSTPQRIADPLHASQIQTQRIARGPIKPREVPVAVAVRPRAAPLLPALAVALVLRQVPHHPALRHLHPGDIQVLRAELHAGRCVLPRGRRGRRCGGRGVGVLAVDAGGVLEKVDGLVEEPLVERGAGGGGGGGEAAVARAVDDGDAVAGEAAGRGGVVEGQELRAGDGAGGLGDLDRLRHMRIQHVVHPHLHAVSHR